MDMEMKDGVGTFYASSEAQWRDWLLYNSEKEDAIWLIIYKKNSKVSSVYYPEAVDQALCFGWVDSKPNKRDHESYYQYFSKRNPKSNWSKVNKEKVKRLIEKGEMSKQGFALIELAKKTGTWDALNDVDNLIVPTDLQKAFDGNKLAFNNWTNFPPSTRRGILEWIFNAKRSATREKRIKETVCLAQENIRANQYSPK